MTTIWKRYQSTIISNCTEKGIRRNSVIYWKNQLFAVTVACIIPLSLVALIPGIYVAWNSGLYGMLAADFITVSTILGVALLPGISVFHRKILFTASLYLVSFVLLFYLGSNGPGLLYLLTVTIFVLLSLDRFFGYLAFGLNTLICVYFGLAIHYGFASNAVLDQYRLDTWIGVSSNLVFLSGTLAFLFPKLFEGLQTSFDEQFRAERNLQASLSEKETLLMEIHHRVKNNLAIVSGMMQLQALGEDNWRLRQKLNDSVGRIKTMGIIHELLYRSESFSRLRADENIKTLITEIAGSHRKDLDLDLRFNLHPLDLNINQAIPLSLIVNEVVTNVFKHAFEGRDEGRLSIEISEERGYVEVRIRDDGKGLPPDFGLSSESDSLGLQLIDNLSGQLEGDYDYRSVEGGTRFTLNFRKRDVKGTGSAMIE